MSEINSHLPFELLSAYIDDEVRPAERVSIERHLAGCAHCRAELDGLRRTAALLTRLPERRAPRTFYITEAMVTPVTSGPTWWRRLLDAWQPLAAGASTLAALLLVALFVITPAAAPAPEIASGPALETVEQAAPAVESLSVDEPAAAEEPVEEMEESAAQAAPEEPPAESEGEGEAASAQSAAPSAADAGTEIEPDSAVGVAATEIAEAPAAEIELLEEAPAGEALEPVEEAEAATEETELSTEQLEFSPPEGPGEPADEAPTATDESEILGDEAMEDTGSVTEPTTHSRASGVDEGSVNPESEVTARESTARAAPLLGRRTAGLLAVGLLLLAALLLASWGRARGRV